VSEEEEDEERTTKREQLFSLPNSPSGLRDLCGRSQAPEGGASGPEAVADVARRGGGGGHFLVFFFSVFFNNGK
jgi:hypothetical protein